MLRTRLLTATAAIALFGAGSAFAQDTTAPAQPAPVESMTPATPPAPAQTPATAPQTTPSAPAAVAAGAQTPAVANNVVDVLRAQGQFTTLLSALDAAQLTETLSTQPAISIFAPTDAAFAALPEADRTRLLDPANANELRQLLLYHVVVADVNSSQIDGARGGVETAARTQVQLDGTGDAIKVDNATVTTADIDAGNGSIFIIDSVLNPAQSLVATGDADEAAAPADAAAAPAGEAPAATPPVDEDADEATPPAEDGMTEESMDAEADTDEGEVAPPPTTPSASTSTTTSVTTPSAAATTTTTTRPAAGVRAPTGQPAATVTTTASPTVPNPTDGQQDEDDADTTAPTPQS